MEQKGHTGMLVCEHLACALLIGWLRVGGVRTHRVMHHVLHAAPLAVLLVVEVASPTDGMEDMLAKTAGYLSAGGRAFPDLRVPMAGLFPPVA